MVTGTVAPTTKSEPGQPLFPARYATVFFLVTGLFFLWGIPNNLNDVLIRQFMKSFEITRLKAGLVQSAFYFGYFAVSMPAAIFMRKLGYKAGILTGLGLYTLGTLLFWPAAEARSYPLFLIGLFVIASGLGFLETGANPLVTQLGEPSSAAGRLNLAQAFNPIGSIVGVLIGTLFIFSGVELKPLQIAAMRAAGTYEAYLRHETVRVIVPYLALGGAVFLWGLLLLRTRFPALATDEADADGSHGKFRELLRYPHFLKAVFAQFCYVGAQVGTWSYFIQYVQDYTHSPERVAGYFLTGTLAGFMLGRFAATVLMRRIAANVLMGWFAVINIALVSVAVLHPGWAGLWCLFLTSFFMSLMYPTIFVLGLNGLGRNTKIGGSWIVMAIIGGAVFTPVMGLVAQHAGSMAIGMTVPLVGYIVVAYYGFVGSRVRGPVQA
jgi:FHS family L-fucose permease-like MFS transporter